MVDWSQLPKDLVSLIALKLHILPDFRALSLVCVRWQQATKQRWQKYHLQVPLLMLPSQECSTSCELYNISNHEKIQFQLPELEHNFHGNFSQGWLATQSHNMDIYLVNPYTRVKIPLLPAAPLLTCQGNYLLHLVKLSCNPTLAECVIIGGFSNMQLGFRKIGDEKWNVLHDVLVDDAIYYNDMIYVAECRGVYNELTILRYLGKEQKKWHIAQKKWHIAHVPHLPRKNRAYLFRSSLSNNLFCLVRHYHGACRRSCNVTIFHVMRLDENSQRWIRVDSLDGEALFLSYDNAVSVSVSQIPGSTLKGDCIYFFGCRIFNGEECIFHHGFVGIFCMKSKQTEKILIHPHPFRRLDWFQQVVEV
ncbi:F-box domain-containing protein [Dioscorea alata]|uniref:F-box domain-containing protein n=1 Tax=Dioscorea alata TaxID=55571 RepID=A0ACB7ULR6_DIOAL|nr:F-box domain-containing protein [Dioscorea alata]